MSEALSGDPRSRVRDRDVYARLLAKRDRVAELTSSDSAAQRYLVNAVRKDPFLDPSILRVTAQDRVIFAVFVLLNHLVSLCIIEWMISTTVVRTFHGAIIAMASVYTLFLALLTMAVNMSDSDLRIVFNYVNFLAGTGRLIAHISLVWVAVLIVLVAMSTLSTGGLVPAVTDDDRTVLVQQLERTSACVWYTMAVIAFLL